MYPSLFTVNKAFLNIVIVPNLGLKGQTRLILTCLNLGSLKLGFKKSEYDYAQYRHEITFVLALNSDTYPKS